MEESRHPFIPYGTQNIESEDIDAVINVLNGAYLSTGPKIGEFEKAFSEYVGSQYAIALSSGTAALHCACMAAGISRGDEVITTPLTFVATSNVILQCGAIPVFVDINEQTLNIDENKIADKITARTKAIIPVHFGGKSCAMPMIQDIADANGLTIIEDASHALGAKTSDNISIGSSGNMTTFSFHPVKHMTSGEGGMITTNDLDLYKKLCMYRNHGMTRERDSFIDPDEGGWYYEQQVLGLNYRLTDFQAALGMVQLKKVDESLRIRRHLVDLYNCLLSDIPEITLPCCEESDKNAWHLYIIRATDPMIDRKVLFDMLRKCNIGVNVHYRPVYLNPYYKSLGYREGLCPVAERVYSEMITLPMHPKMTDNDVVYISACIHDAIKKVRELSSDK